MASASIYCGLNAKVKAMYAGLLKYDDYYNLSQQKSVKDLADKLCEYPPYKDFIAEIDNFNMHRGIIEQKLIFTLVDDFSRIYKYIYDFDLRSFFDGFFLKNEINILKQFLAHICDGRDITYSTTELHSLFNHKFNIDIQKLITSKTVPDFIDNLKGTEFYDVLYAGYEPEQSLFTLEMKLDVYYYMQLWKTQNKHLDKVNKKAMMKIYGTEIDLRNILWIYRIKKYYKLKDNEIYSYLIPINYKLTKEQVTRMAESKSIDELWSAIKESKYSYAFDEDKTIESGFYKAMFMAYTKSKIQNTNSLALAVSYMYLKEIEIKNITSLLEGVRYGLKQEDIFKYIILSREMR